MPARRQLEHGDCLSQRTLRLRHMIQLRNLDVEPETADERRSFVGPGEVACSSEGNPEASSDTVAPSGPCDMLARNSGCSSLVKPLAVVDCTCASRSPRPVLCIMHGVVGAVGGLSR